MDAVFRMIRSTGFRRGPARILGGICGGIAAATGVNVLWIRVAVLVLFLLPVFGFGLYLLVWALTPWGAGAIPAERFLDGWAGRS
ncbi:MULTISPECIES: PspC domain-containing protein [unclassified Pseudactinotalea]|uniref:PspC domain-containing protein n=1 Tax=unclassified Pseudactinotalea TaxID=2649176 RepID=UPI00128BDBB2|nr:MULTISPECIES: PspC domain-containing protein [unclassified Pseudactinotalea]MPV49499.1 PspC domain-containing protein [Pseudactinotalea sp. HY160]QGH69813.1 PspC domain-containing protein [Pseudactinotalea sp. HY158]